MPINMTCPSCGKTLAAPDSAVGKQAKCPGCGQIMVVPAAVQDAETFGVASPQPQSPLEPQPSGGGAAAGDAERRPCPECGETIIAGAAKCRFCGAVFDPRLKLQARKGGEDENNLSAVDWVICIILSGIGCIIYAIQGKPKGLKMVGISIAFDVLKAIIIVSLQAIG